MLEKDLWSDGEYNCEFEVAETYADKIQQKLLLHISKLVSAPVVNTSQQENNTKDYQSWNYLKFRFRLSMVNLSILGGS